MPMLRPPKKPASSSNMRSELMLCHDLLKEWGSFPPSWEGIGQHVMDVSGAKAHFVMSALRTAIFYFTGRMTVAGWEEIDKPTFNHILDLLRFTAVASELGLVKNLHEYYEGQINYKKVDKNLTPARIHTQCKYLKRQRRGTPGNGQASEKTMN